MKSICISRLGLDRGTDYVPGLLIMMEMISFLPSFANGMWESSWRLSSLVSARSSFKSLFATFTLPLYSTPPSDLLSVITLDMDSSDERNFELADSEWGWLEWCTSNRNSGYPSPSILDFFMDPTRSGIYHVTKSRYVSLAAKCLKYCIQSKCWCTLIMYDYYGDIAPFLGRIFTIHQGCWGRERSDGCQMDTLQWYVSGWFRYRRRMIASSRSFILPNQEMPFAR